MSYTVTNFPTKKALKEAVNAYAQAFVHGMALNSEVKVKPVRCYNPGAGPDLTDYNGKVYLEGPHYPKPHTWYAEAILKDGIVISVK